MTDIQDVLTANHGFYRAFEKRDINAMGAVWSKTTEAVCIHPGREPLKGWEQIRTAWEEIFGVTDYLEVKANVVALNVIGNVAYVVLAEDILQVAQGDRIEAKSIATNVLERMAGGWYVVLHHGSPIMRPMEEMQMPQDMQPPMPPPFTPR
jgi:ketosteroid isomerase-like protein